MIEITKRLYLATCDNPDCENSQDVLVPLRADSEVVFTNMGWSVSDDNPPVVFCAGCS